MSISWLKAVFNAPVPLWFALPLIVLAGIFAWKGLAALMERAKTIKAIEYLKEQRENDVHEITLSAYWQQRAKRFEERVGEFESKAPRLHGVWNNTQTFWAMGQHGEEPMTQIGGWINITSSNTQDNIFLLAAYIEVRRSELFMDVHIKPNVLNEVQVFLYFWPPLATETGKDFEAIIVVEDQFNRKYELPAQTFRSVAATVQISKRAPQLHASWLATSGWGWVGSTLVDEGFRTFMIRGEATFLFEHASESIHVVGVGIEGAKSMGDFTNFDLTPGETIKRQLRLYFQGKVPSNNDYYEVALIFRDIKGNKYATAPHRFIPLPIPERVTLDRHPSTAMIVPRRDAP